MTVMAVSVIVVSRGRAQALLRCLSGLEQLYHSRFEVIVVADPEGLAAVQTSRFDGCVKVAAFDQPNISAARNLGLAQAAGEIVAFIDDDAVAEPTWLDHLSRPFADPEVAAAGGFVRARNGISFQSRARRVDYLGRHTEITVPGENDLILSSAPGDAVKTEGTNCALRCDMLLAMGGFDPAFHYFLDETDLNLRLALNSAATAIVPRAQVHHGFAASVRRHASRMPRSLFDVGASLLVFLRKHAPAANVAVEMDTMRAEQRVRLVRHMVAGTCEPRDVGRLMQTLEEGFGEGQKRAIAALPPIPRSDGPLLAFRTLADAPPHILAGRSWSRSRLVARARSCLSRGERTSVFVFSPTSLYHRVSFDPAGFWLQSGGLFGKSDRSDPAFRLFGFSARLQRELRRQMDVRGFIQ